MDRPAYDTKEGIAATLISYPGLYALFKARREAGYERHEHLTIYVILGRFSLDECGNWWKLDRRTFTDAHRTAMPAVMDVAEFDAFIAGIPGIDEWPFFEGIEGMSLSQPPAPSIVCASCGGGWEFASCHDYDCVGDIESQQLEPHVGKTIGQVQAELDLRTDAVRFVHTSVRSDRWIDPKARGSRRDGWRDEHSKEGPIGPDYVIQSGDEGTISTYRYYHGPCYRKIEEADAAAEKTETVAAFKEAFEQCGFTDVRVERIPLPQHILDWMRREGDDDELEGADEELAYLKIDSDQGTIGIFLAAYPTIDLTGSGISLAELVPEMEALPQGMPQIVGFDGDPATLLKLWQLMVKRQASQRP